MYDCLESYYDNKKINFEDGTLPSNIKYLQQ